MVFQSGTVIFQVRNDPGKGRATILLKDTIAKDPNFSDGVHLVGLGVVKRTHISK